MAEKGTATGIEINDGVITLVLEPAEAALLAKACSMAEENPAGIEDIAQIRAFRVWAVAFKAATLAAIGQMEMVPSKSTEGYLLNLFDLNGVSL